MGQVKSPVAGKMKWNIISAEMVDSTNTVAMELGGRGAPHGTVVVARRQTAGRGRFNRSWISPEGNIYMSILLRPVLALSALPLLTLTAAVACARALKETAEFPVEIKWPNDLMASGKKIGGILTEAKSRGKKVLFIIVGIGINLNSDAADFPPELRAIATSLKAETGREIRKNGLIRNILREMESWCGTLMEGRSDRVLDEWKRLSSTLGRSVRITTGEGVFEGVAETLDETGRLVLRLASGARKVIGSGDVIMAR